MTGGILLIELLAPAGSRESLIAAVEAGADAVYLAGSQFGARAYANNFDADALADAIRFAHLRGVHVHVTVNTMVLDDELDAVREYLKFLERIHADAALVQDLGVAKLARDVAPNLPLHASTQMTIHNAEGARAMEALGFSRVVLSRELSLPEIREVVAGTNAEVEVFMHGALGVCYSGQCLMSSMIGDRSGNRGCCAQPCRLPYTLVDETGTDVLGDTAGNFLLSPRDLNTLDVLPELVKAGVSSLKIEGRMKKPEYVATVVRTYRAVLDRILAQQDATPSEEEHEQLAQIFNRDFTTAYLEGRPGRAMMSDRKPNNRGRLVGRIVSYDKAARRAKLHLTKELSVEDDLVIWVKVGGRVTSRVQEMMDAEGRPIDHAAAGQDVTIHMANPVHPHDRVFKVYDVRLMAEAKKYYTSGAPIRRIPVDIKVTAPLGAPLTVTMTDDDGHTVTAETEFHGEPAKKRPLTEETVRKQIDRLGTSVYALRDLKTTIADGVMFPMSEINKARQRATDQLDAVRLEEFERRGTEGVPSTAQSRKPLQPTSATPPVSSADSPLWEGAKGIGVPPSPSEGADDIATADRLGESNEALLSSVPPSQRGEGHEVAGGVSKVRHDNSHDSNLRRNNVSSSILVVSADTLDQVASALRSGADAILFGGDSYRHEALGPQRYEQALRLVRDAGRRMYFNTPRIVRSEHFPQVRAVLEAAQSLAPDGVYVQNIGLLDVARAMGLPVSTDSSLVAANRETLSFFAGEGVRSVTLSPELTLEQVRRLAAVSPLPLECIVHGPLELMVSEYCAIGSFLGAPKDGTCPENAPKTGVPGCSMPCVRGHYALRDRKGIDFPLVTDQFCHMHILNSRPLSMLPHVHALRDAGVSRLRIEGRSYAPQDLATIVHNYHRVLGMSESAFAAVIDDVNALEGKDFTRGHYFRGVGVPPEKLIKESNAFDGTRIL